MVRRGRRHVLRRRRQWPSSLHGTGTEDYFNAPGRPNALFQHPFYGLRGPGTGWLGRTHATGSTVDPVRFDKSLRYSIEHGHDNNLPWTSRASPTGTRPSRTGRSRRSPRVRRQALAAIGNHDLHLWRDAWRKARGSGPLLWGNEKPKEK